MDIYCAKCGEPWDSYSLRNGDLGTPSEVKRFREGKGCPACHWGKACVACSGTGKARKFAYQDEDCPHCHGSRILVVRRLNSQRYNEDWHYGYEPHVKTIPLGNDFPHIGKIEMHQCRDGYYKQAVIDCPYCKDYALDCPDCNGTGKLNVSRQLKEDLQRQFMYSSLEATDDPENDLPWLK